MILTQFHIRSVTHDQTKVLSREVYKNENSLQIRTFTFIEGRKRMTHGRTDNSLIILKSICSAWSHITARSVQVFLAIFHIRYLDYPQTQNRTVYNVAFYTFSSSAIRCRSYSVRKFPFRKHISIRPNTLPASVPRECCAS